MAGNPKQDFRSALVPHIVVDNTAAAIEFYKKAFGAVEIARHPAPDGKKIMHAAVTVNGMPLMLNDDFPEFTGRPSTPTALGGSPVTLHLNVPDVDAAWKRAVSAGAQVVMPLADQFWGDRYGKLRDPSGHEWSMSTSKGKPSEDELIKGAKEAFATAPKAKGWPRRTARASGPTKPAAAARPAKPAGRASAKSATATKGKKRR